MIGRLSRAFRRITDLARRRPYSAALLALCIAGVIFYVAAPVPIAAGIGRFPGIGWVLHTYMEHWARSRAIGDEKAGFVEVGDPALVRLGAGYFETGCAPCHGAPGRERNPLVEMMEPPPPDLAGRISNFGPKELYVIVWNGVRYTAMPGWAGKDRKDEVWAMVAFLLHYPSLDGREYLDLAYGPVAPEGIGERDRMSFGGLVSRLGSVVDNCARCHGEDGLGRDGTAPKLAGQSREFLYETLAGYARGERQSGIMEPIAAPLTDRQMRELADYYASLPPFGADPPTGGIGAPDLELLRRGERLAANGAPDRMVPACNSCHLQGGNVPPRPVYPRIAGQERRFIEAWLRLYRDRPFGATEFANVMHHAAEQLTDDQIEAVAAWFSSISDTSAVSAADRGEARPLSGVPDQYTEEPPK